MRVDTRGVVLVAIGLGSLALLLALPPIAQDPRYHAFADGRAMLGAPNFMAIASNLPFLLVGGVGLVYAAARPALPSRWSWMTMFAAVTLVAPGSAYYHWAPSNPTLVWDRIPMAIAFMAFFTAVLNDYVSRRAEQWLLAPLCLLGVASVVWWHYSGDLRVYVWVQFAPLLCLLMIVVLYPDARRDRRYLAGALLLYFTAKLAEIFDVAIFRVTTEALAGHTLKHLLAAASCYVLYRLLRTRGASE